jgi:hypothetical protein
MKRILTLVALLGLSFNSFATDLNHSLAGFTPLQVQAMKGTFSSLTASQVITGTTQINTLKIGTSGTIGAFNVFPTTAAKGSLRLLAADSAGDTVTTITNASQAGARTYTVPDAGASASFVMTEGAQTVNGAKAFGSAITPTGGVAAAGGFSVAPRGLHAQGVPATAATSGNDSTPSITETYIQSIFVPANMTITGVKVFNGSDVTGNIRVGLANAVTGAPIAAALTASTAGSGTDAYQTIPFATPYAAVGPANYLVCVQYSSATARYNTHTVGTDPVIVQTGTVYGTMPTVSPLPTTFTTNVGNIISFY